MEKKVKNWKTKWTQREIDFLRDCYGRLSYKMIGARLGRTKRAVMNKARYLKLGRVVDQSELVPFGEFYGAISGGRKISFARFIKIRPDFPYKTIELVKREQVMINLDDFWKWLKDNGPKLNLSEMEPFALGPEPSWVAKKRAEDYKVKRLKGKMTRWTDTQIATLKSMLDTGRYELEEISKRVSHTPAAVLRRILLLDLPYSPKRVKNHKWNDEQIKRLKELILEKDDLLLVSEELGIPWSTVKSKCVRVFNTGILLEMRKVIKETA